MRLLRLPNGMQHLPDLLLDRRRSRRPTVGHGGEQPQHGPEPRRRPTQLQHLRRQRTPLPEPGTPTPPRRKAMTQPSSTPPRPVHDPPRSRPPPGAPSGTATLDDSWTPKVQTADNGRFAPVAVAPYDTG